MVHYEMITLIKELIELLREDLTNLTTKSPIEPYPKNLQPQTNQT